MLTRLIFSKTDSGVFFIALALGYLVCYFAKREEGFLKRLGYSIGALVIVFSGIFLLGKLSIRLKACHRDSKAWMMQMQQIIQEEQAKSVQVK